MTEPSSLRLAVDGICFQRAATGVGRVWTSLLPHLAELGDVDVILFDRGGSPSISGVELRPFPSYTGTYTAADSTLLQEFCNEVGADVFTSTGFTSVLTTPQVQVLHHLSQGSTTCSRLATEQRLTLGYAGHFACTSANMRERLLHLCPAIPPGRVVVTQCGVDTAVFDASASAGLDAWRDRIGIHQNFIVLIGGLGQDCDARSIELIFEAMKLDPAARFDIVYIGGEHGIERSWSQNLPHGVRAVRLDPCDAELATAFSAAIASIHLSRDAGFVSPLEAMASGCPLITTRQASLSEDLGDAPHYVSDQDAHGLLRAIYRVQISAIRRGMAAAGISRAREFHWNTMAHQFRALLRAAVAERRDASVIAFHRRWTELRKAQAEVDVGVD